MDPRVQIRWWPYSQAPHRRGPSDGETGAWRQTRLGRILALLIGWVNTGPLLSPSKAQFPQVWL